MNGDLALPALSVLRWLTIFPLALFGLVMVGAWSGHRSLQRTIRELSRTPRPGCGRAFGEPAVIAAQTAWNEEFLRMREEQPGVIFRVVAHWPLRCPGCGCAFQFRVQDARLIPA